MLTSQPVALTPEALLARESEGYRALVETLQREQDALRKADADTLRGIVPIKLRQLERVEDDANERRAAMRRLGLTDNASGLDRWLTGSSDPSVAKSAWKDLLALAAEAKRLNGANERLNARQLRHFDRAIAALSKAAGHSAVYGADGRQHLNPYTRTIAAI